MNEYVPRCLFCVARSNVGILGVFQRDSWKAWQGLKAYLVSVSGRD